MTQVRVYLPVSPAQCRQLAERRTLPTPAEAYAVTEAVRASDPAGGMEEWEHAALQDAAVACAHAGAPVIVAAADVDPHLVDDSGSTGSRVSVTEAVPLQRIAAFHLGDDVLHGLPLDPAGGELELSWYDTTELEDLLQLL